MHSNSAIFAVSTILLVPFLYYAASMPDACAAAHHPRYASGTCTGDDNTGKTCCWREQKEGSILGDTYCQTCTLSYDAKTKVTTEKCGLVTKQLMKPPTTDESGPLQGGGVLEEPTSLLNFSQSVDPNVGIFQAENNLTFSQANITRDNSANTLAELESDVQHDTEEESNAENGAEEEQDESEETDDESEEQNE